MRIIMLTIVFSSVLFLSFHNEKKITFKENQNQPSILPQKDLKQNHDDQDDQELILLKKKLKEIEISASDLCDQSLKVFTPVNPVDLRESLDIPELNMSPSILVNPRINLSDYGMDDP